jgi:carboxyl-terminal processing protease
MKRSVSGGVILLCIALLGGACAGRAEPASATNAADSATTTNVADSAANAYRQMELLTEVLLQIRKNYVDERTYEELMHGALNGLLNSLDEHSSFMEPDEYEDLLDDTSGKYGGIGIHIGMRDGIVTVIAPIEDTPAFRAGLQSGDKIVEIDGESTAALTLREVVNRLRGAKGEAVKISVVGSGDAEPRVVEIIRDVIEVASVKGAQILANGIAYVRLTQFAEPTAAMLRESLERLRDEGMKALVLDLRGNPGGLLNQAVRVAELFLETDQMVVSTKGRSELGARVEYRAAGDMHFTNVPMAVLVNDGSASASEIVAGAIQDHRRGVLVGQKTFGKGSVQSVIRSRTDGESAIRLTTAYYYTPAERLIHKIGIEPDIPVEIGREAWVRVQRRRAHLETPDAFTAEDKAAVADAVDVQLQRAVDLLQALLIINRRDGA